MRKSEPVAAFANPKGGGVVVCGDGSVWISQHFGTDLEWLELPPIPGSLREDQKKDEG